MKGKNKMSETILDKNEAPEEKPLRQDLAELGLAVVPKKEVKKEAREEKKEEKPKAQPVNNILLGEITEELLEEIKPGKVVQLNFYEKQIKFVYKVQPNQSDASVLSILRDAVFCTQYNKPLPEGVRIETPIVYPQGINAALSLGSIASTGEIDARIEVFEA